jgi:NADPH:quinone reductase-like Zn-dependent oxidoreductase
MKARARQRHINYSYVFVTPDGNMLREIGGFCEQGLLRPVIDKVFPFQKCLEAMELLENGHVTGKIVIEFDVNSQTESV